MKIYLLRHGLTEYNKDKRYQGTRDIPLSEEGRAQLAAAFPELPVIADYNDARIACLLPE